MEDDEYPIIHKAIFRILFLTLDAKLLEVLLDLKDLVLLQAREMVVLIRWVSIIPFITIFKGMVIILERVKRADNRISFGALIGNH